MAKGKGYCYGKGYCMVKEGQGSPKGSALSESKPDKFYQPQIKQDIMLIKQSSVILAISESANVKKNFQIQVCSGSAEEDFDSVSVTPKCYQISTWNFFLSFCLKSCKKRNDQF